MGIIKRLISTMRRDGSGAPIQGAFTPSSNRGQTWATDATTAVENGAAFDGRKLVLLRSDSDCFIRFGATGVAPTVTTLEFDYFLPADTDRAFDPNGNQYVGILNVTADPGVMYAAELE